MRSRALATASPENRPRGSCSRCARTGRRRIPTTMRKATSRSVGQLHEDLVGDQRDALLLLGGAVLAVLLIVCVNLAGAAGFAWRGAATRVCRAARAWREPPAPRPAVGRRSHAACSHRRRRRACSSPTRCLRDCWHSIRPAACSAGRSRSTTLTLALHRAPRHRRGLPRRLCACLERHGIASAGHTSRATRAPRPLPDGGARAFRACRRAVGVERDPARGRAAADSVAIRICSASTSAYRTDGLLTFDVFVPPARQPDPAVARRTLAAIEDASRDNARRRCQPERFRRCRWRRRRSATISSSKVGRRRRQERPGGTRAI